MSIERKHTAVKSNKVNAKTDDLIEKGLRLGWSPDAISRRMKLEKLSKDEPLSLTPPFTIEWQKTGSKEANSIVICLASEKHAGKVESAIGMRVRS